MLTAVYNKTLLQSKDLNLHCFQVLEIIIFLEKFYAAAEWPWADAPDWHHNDELFQVFFLWLSACCQRPECLSGPIHCEAQAILKLWFLFCLTHELDRDIRCVIAAILTVLLSLVGWPGVPESYPYHSRGHSLIAIWAPLGQLSEAPVCSMI